MKNEKIISNDSEPPRIAILWEENGWLWITNINCSK